MEILQRQTKPRWMLNLGDFANMVKAFVGSSYLNTAYGFKQSGLGLGIIGMVVIAFLTDHCCHLIAKTKHHVIEKLLHKQESARDSNRRHYNSLNTQNESELEHRDEHLKSLPDKDTTPLIHKASKNVELSIADTGEGTDTDQREHMLKHMTYGDIGKLSFGQLGVFLVNFSIALTQFGFCVGYFILIGNTVHSLFPTRLCYLFNGTKNCSPFNNSGYNISQMNSTITDASNYSITVTEESAGISRFSGTSSPLLSHSRIIHVSEENFITSGHQNATPADFVRTVETDAPDLRILVVAPLPAFIVLVFIRSVRFLGVISTLANISMLIGILTVIGFLLSGFSLHDEVVWFNWEKFPIFFGMVTGAFEGISLVIPIESSMEGNRDLFPCFLHGAILSLTAVLGSFGILGYLKYGDTVKQMLNTNIPQGNPLSMAVNICICLGILLTFPLQMFPVIEILEKILFTGGKLCGSKMDTQRSGNTQHEESKNKARSENVASHIPQSVPAWKRNILRVTVVLVLAGIAVVMKDNFAYVYAFVGALGSSLLVYVLPCLFHLKICWNDINPYIKTKDISLIAFGLVGGVVSVYTVIRNTKV